MDNATSVPNTFVPTKYLLTEDYNAEPHKLVKKIEWVFQFSDKKNVQDIFNKEITSIQSMINELEKEDDENPKIDDLVGLKAVYQKVQKYFLVDYHTVYGHGLPMYSNQPISFDKVIKLEYVDERIKFVVMLSDKIRLNINGELYDVNGTIEFKTRKPNMITSSMNFVSQPPTSGGDKKKSLKKTSQKVQYKNRSCVVYQGARGGKYIKHNKEYVSIKKLGLTPK